MIKCKYIVFSTFLPLLAVMLLLSFGWEMKTASAAPAGAAVHSSLQETRLIAAPLCEVETTGNNVTDFSSVDATALQDAVDSVASGALIKVAGTCAGVQTQLGVTQTVYIDKNITVQGGYTSTAWTSAPDPVTNPTILDAIQSGRVVYIASGNITVVLDRLTLTGGNGSGGGNGGGIFAGNDVNWSLTNSNLNENTTSSRGGGIYNAAVQLTISNTTIMSNTTISPGGGIHTNGPGVADLINSVVENNNALIGGGLHLDMGGVLNLDGTTVQHNHATANGGGVANDTSVGQVNIINNSTIVSNTADDSGAGIFNNGILVVDTSTIEDNEATDDGGGLLNHLNGQATVTNSIIDNNRARDPGGLNSNLGAGIFNRLGGSLNVMTSTLQNNTATFSGGAIWNGGTLVIASSQILGNKVSSTNGGGLLNTSSASITDSTLAFNEARNGGAVYNTGSGVVTIAKSTIHDNLANGAGTNRGGGVYVDTGRLNLVNSTLSQNFAVNDGGAVANNSFSDLTLATIVSNSVNLGTGAGVYNTVATATMTLTNSVIAYHSGPDCAGAVSSVVDNGYNLVEDGSCLSAGTSVSGDPLLGPLANNGGSTETHLPLAFSPVIDWIPAIDCVAAEDQRGVVRPVDGACDIGSVELAANFAPTAVADDYTTTEDVTLIVTATGVLTNDIDADFGPLTPITDTNVTNGALTLNSDGSFEYTPNADFCGVDSFTYHVNDGHVDSNIVTVTLNVTCVNDLPVAVDDTYTTTEDIPLTEAAPGVMSNDMDADGDPLTAVLDTTVLTGTLVFTDDGSFNFTPPLSWSGSTTFTYHVTDGVGSSSIATVTLVVSAANDAPAAVDDSYTTAEDETLNVGAPGILDNDSDADGDPLTAVLESNVLTGTLVLTDDGSFAYTPPLDWSGVTTFTYHANDGLADSNTAVVTITVTSVNDAPIAVADSYTGTEDVPLVVVAPGVLDNDSDAEGDGLTAELDTDVTSGTLALNGDGSFDYTPDADFCGTDSFTYHANDGQADSSIVTVTLDIACVNDIPVALDDSYPVAENGILIVAAPGVLNNDSEVDGDPLTAVLENSVITGTLVFTDDGSFNYTPPLNWTGVTTFTYHAEAGGDSSNTAVVTITVGGVNQPPVAVSDSYTTTEDTLLLIAAPGVLANDSDADFHSLTAVLDSDVTNGALVLSSNGSFDYTPNTDFCGTDSFSYHAFDGQADSNTATVTIEVTCVNDAPLAIDDNYIVSENSSDNSLTVLVNDSDIDGDALSITDVTAPGNGTANISGSTILYTPDPDFVGTDTFIYTVSDGLLTATATVTITVESDGGFTVYIPFIVVAP